MQDKTTKQNNKNKDSDKDEKSQIKEEFKDKQLPCKTCQKTFTWSAKEQKYYKKKGYKKQPQKCSSCREKANKLRKQSMFYVHCGFCDNDAVFISPPPKDRVAICSECYLRVSKNALSG